MCYKCGDPGYLRCHECGLSKLLCGFCDEDVHQALPLHNREAWCNNYFQAVPPNVTCGMDGETITTGKLARR